MISNEIATVDTVYQNDNLGSDSTRPLYVVAITDCQSNEPERWLPVRNAIFWEPERAESEASMRSLTGIQGDKYAVLEYSASGVKIAGEIHHGMNEW